MHLQFLLNPVVAYLLAALGLLVSLVLFANIRWEIAKSCHLNLHQAQEFQTAQVTDREAIRTLEAEVESLRDSVRHLERIPSNRRDGLSINLAKRAQALRMYR